MKKINFILLFIIMSMCLFAQTTQKPTVVVVPFDVKEVPADEAEVLFEVFQSEFANTGKAKVVDRSSLDKIKKQQEFQNSDWSNADKVAELGKALNASMVVTGQIMVFQKKYIVTVKLIHVNTTEIVSSVVKKVTDTGELLDKLPEMAKELGERISGQVIEDSSQKKSQNGTTSANAIAITATTTTTTTIPSRDSYQSSQSEQKTKDNYYIKYPHGFATLLSFGIICFVSSAIFMIASGAYDAYYIRDIYCNSNLVDETWYYRISSRGASISSLDNGDKSYDYNMDKYQYPSFLCIGLGGGIPFFVAGIVFTVLTSVTIYRESVTVIASSNKQISRNKKTIAFLRRTSIDGGYNLSKDEVTVGMTVKI